MESAKKTRSRTKSGQGDTLDTVTSDTEATLNGERPKKEEESVIEAENHDAEQQADEEEPKSDKPSEEITSTENSTEKTDKADPSNAVVTEQATEELMDADSEVKGDEAKDDSSEKEKSAETDQEDKEMVVVVEDTFFKGFDKQSQMSEVKLSPESLIEKLSESEPKEKASRGRKRKAADLKSGDENENEDTLKDEHSEDGKQNADSVKEKKSKQKNENSDVESTEDKAKPNEDSPSSFLDTSDLNLPSKDILGKGKRARIPNKRYSDIMLSARSKPTENGSLDRIETEDIMMVVKEEPVSPAELSGGPNPAKKPKLYDLSDPKFLKPFDYGWKRELVYRSTGGTTTKRMGDIYYYTPQGKKVRSMREVSENLPSRYLTMENFTFFKEPLGLNDTEKEVIRDAKVGKGGASSSFTSDSSPSKILSPKLKPSGLVKKAIEKAASTNRATPRSPKLAAASSKAAASPKAAPSPKTSPRRVQSPKVQSPKVLSPKMRSPKMQTPKVQSPKVHSPRVGLSSAINETTDSPASSERSLRGKSANQAKMKGKLKLKAPVKKEKKANSKTDEEMKTEPPAKSPPAKRGRWSKQAAPAPAAAPPKAKKRTLKISKSSDEKEEKKFMENYLQNMSYGYNTLLYVFQYLKVQDLLRAGCVCTMWRDLASHPMLWRTVRMKNSQVHSFEGLANTLKKHGTRHLDLRKMLLPTGGDEIWPEFSDAIGKVDTLRKIELCRCPASVVEKLAESNPLLEVINAVTIKCESMDLSPFKNLTNIQELRIKSTSGLALSSNLDSLKELKELRHLSLTSIRDLDSINLDVIAELTNLESLDLGECTDFPEQFGSNILCKLEKLEKLRLEKGQGNCHTFEILEAVKDMPKLEQLELVNFDIKAGFDKALGGCRNIRKLLIIPTYISQSATTNHMVLGGVLRLQKTLSHFVWGVTLELLRVTELFVDQCEEPKKEKKTTVGNGDCIPVLKPVPLLKDKDGEIPPAHDPPQVEILALPCLQKLLMQNLPTTRVKILKIPFHATWRQSITDSVN